MALTYDSLCLSGSKFPEYDGTYTYNFTISDSNELVWYNSINKQYIFPWGIKWYVGPDYMDGSRHLECGNATTTDSGYYSLLDAGCDNWREYLIGAGWEANNEITIKHGACNESLPVQADLSYYSLCLSNSIHTLNGTYNFYKVISDPDGLVWKHSKSLYYYLYPYHSGHQVVWQVGSNYSTNLMRLYCAHAGATIDGYYDILEVGCYPWYEWNGKNWTVNPEILITGGSCIQDTDSNVNHTNRTNQTNQLTTTESTWKRDIVNITYVQALAEWDCGSHTDFSQISFNETFSSAENYLITVMTLALIYFFFAVIHDSTLIYYKQDLNLVSFIPTNYDEYYLVTTMFRIMPYWFEKFVTYITENCNCFCIGILSIVVMGLPALALWTVFTIIFWLIDLIHMLIVRPIMVCFGMKQKLYNIPTICYISAGWIGVTRFSMAIVTMLMLIKWSTEAFFTDIPSLNPHLCDCRCVYILKEWDWYKLLGTTVLFTTFNIQFLWSWTMETIHGNDFLYLISYTLPIKYAHRINPEECTGSMMKEIPPVETVTPTQIPLTENKYYRMTEEKYRKDTYHKTESLVAFQFRGHLLLFSVFWYLFGGVVIFVYAAINNYYKYSDAVVVILGIVGIVMEGTSVFALYLVGKKLQKMYVQHNTEKNTAE
eukprot:190314_1